MNRRTFLKLWAACLTWVTALQQTKMVSAENSRLIAAPTPYGKGEYGKAVYPGYQKVYLPLISQEGN